jgi:hypothetical protein
MTNVIRGKNLGDAVENPGDALSEFPLRHVSENS